MDLTTTLRPKTPVIDLPPVFAPSPGLTLTEISGYDARGPAWYWNVLSLGEHTGTEPEECRHRQASAERTHWD